MARSSVLSGHGRAMARRVAAALLSLVFLLGVPSLATAQTANREYAIKAAFLFNFAQFVKWPHGGLADPQTPFCIGVLGDDPFGGALEGTVTGESIDGHRMVVKHGHSLGELEGCQMIFVCDSESADAVVARLGSRPVLTVGNEEGFARHGGDVDFYLADGKIRFEINPSAAKKCGLQISSQLLNLGRIVEP